MRHVKEILRQKLVLRRSHRQIAASLGVSAGVVGETASRAKKRALLEWSAVEELDEAELERRLYGGKAGVAIQRVLPEPAYLDVELRRPGVTLQLLHLEYLEQRADALWRHTVRPLYHQLHPSRHLETIYGVGEQGATVYVILKQDRPYQLRDVDHNPVTPPQARSLIAKHYSVLEEVRQRNNRRTRKQRAERRMERKFKRKGSRPSR